MILTLLALNDNLLTAVNKFSASREALELTNTSIIYQNVDSLTRDFDKTGYALTATQNLVPFIYDLNEDTNVLSIEWSAPFGQSQLQDSLDYFLLAKIFLKDTNYSNAYQGALVDVNIPTNLSFSIPSNGFDFNIVDSNNQLFDYSAPGINLKQVDFNITLPYTSDFNIIEFDGITCPGADCPIGASYKYRVSITCTKTCSINPKDYNIISNSDFNFTLSCQGGSCPELLLKKQGAFINLIYSGDKKVVVRANTTFNETPSGFVLADTNIGINSKSTQRQSD